MVIKIQLIFFYLFTIYLLALIDFLAAGSAHLLQNYLNHWNISSENEVSNDICTCNEQMILKCVAATANEMLQLDAVNNPDVVVLN